ncbi:MAG: LTA synthase family protein, partial [Bacteroidota bacterium]
LFFIITRAVFILANTDDLHGISTGQILLTFWYALPLDLSTACYILVFPFFLIFLRSLFRIGAFNVINRFYVYFVLFIVALITAGELGIYDEWGTKLNYKALTYLKNPDEIMRTAKAWVLIGGVLLIIILMIIGIIGYHKTARSYFITRKRNYLFSAVFLILTPGLLLLGIRGGMQQITIRQSDVYFSKNQFINTATVNSGWNLIHSIYKNKKYMNENPYKYYNYTEAKSRVDSLHYTENDSTIKILTTDTPNIVILILESWAADIVPSCGGDSGITPRFDKLVNEGIIFSNIYGTAARSDQGIVAIFSGFPAQPTTSIIEQPNKAVKLPCITDPLKERGYFTSFHFGGQLNYGNIKGYLIDHGFDYLYEETDFPGDIPKGRLGYHDEFMLAQFLKDIGTFREPFMAAAFTMSSHSPYDQPFPEVLHWGDDEKDFINSAYYTDSCLGVFFKNAKKQEWYDNTLFIIVADHSHSTPRHTSFLSPEYKKIPMLFFGNVVKEEFRGTRFEKICSQVDIPATLLAQLGIDYKKYNWSKNLFNPSCPEFAYYAFKDGVGWVIPGNQFAYHHQDEIYYIDRIQDTLHREDIIMDGKCYLQVLFEEYLGY